MVSYSVVLNEGKGERILHPAHDGDVLGKDGDVIRRCRASQERSVFRWQSVVSAGRVNFDHPRRDQRPQPLAHIPLVQSSFVRDLGRGGGGQPAHNIEQAGAVADGGHQTQGAIVERRQELSRERFSFGGIERKIFLSCRHGLVSLKVKR